MVGGRCYFQFAPTTLGQASAVAQEVSALAAAGFAVDPAQVSEKGVDRGDGTAGMAGPPCRSLRVGRGRLARSRWMVETRRRVRRPRPTWGGVRTGEKPRKGVRWSSPVKPVPNTLPLARAIGTLLRCQRAQLNQRVAHTVAATKTGRIVGGPVFCGSCALASLHANNWSQRSGSNGRPAHYE